MKPSPRYFASPARRISLALEYEICTAFGDVTFLCRGDSAKEVGICSEFGVFNKTLHGCNWASLAAGSSDCDVVTIAILIVLSFWGQKGAALNQKIRYSLRECSTPLEYVKCTSSIKDTKRVGAIPSNRHGSSLLRDVEVRPRSKDLSVGLGELELFCSRSMSLVRRNPQWGSDAGDSVHPLNSVDHCVYR